MIIFGENLKSEPPPPPPSRSAIPLPAPPPPPPPRAGAEIYGSRSSIAIHFALPKQTPWRRPCVQTSSMTKLRINYTNIL